MCKTVTFNRVEKSVQRVNTQMQINAVIVDHFVTAASDIFQIAGNEKKGSKAFLTYPKKQVRQPSSHLHYSSFSWSSHHILISSLALKHFSCFLFFFLLLLTVFTFLPTRSLFLCLSPIRFSNKFAWAVCAPQVIINISITRIQ